VLVAERPWGFDSLRPHRFMAAANSGRMLSQLDYEDELLEPIGRLPISV
jgi:hypothetical protein